MLMRVSVRDCLERLIDRECAGLDARHDAEERLARHAELARLDVVHSRSSRSAVHSRERNSIDEGREAG